MDKTSKDGQGELAAFEERVRLMTEKGMLLPFPVALFVAGISDTRLRQLVASGRLETAVIDQRPYIVLRSLVAYRRRVLKHLGSRKPEAPTTPQSVASATPSKTGTANKASPSSRPAFKQGR